MSVKSFKTIFFLSMLISSSFLYTEQDPKSIDPWRFTEYQLITKPQSFNKTIHIMQLIPAFFVGLSTSFTTSILFPTTSYPYEYDTEKFSKKIIYSTIGITGILGASLLYGMTDSLIQYKVNLQTIHCFIKQWPEYKKYTPEQLHTIFNDVYDMYLFDPRSYKYYNNAIDALTIARNHVYYQFPETYGHLYKRTGLTNRSKRLVFKLLNFAPIKMILNTIKLFV